MSLDDLAVFIQVCRSRGFRDAGRKLGMAASTVSERVQRLEDGLGVQLLVRTTRSVSPTRAGEALAERVGGLFSDVQDAVQEAVSDAGAVRGRLKLDVPGAVMEDILPPLLESFLVRYPEVQLELSVDDNFVDAFARGADAGVRYGERLAQDMISVPIGPATQSAAVVASPAYLERRGHPRHPRELMAHDWIRGRFASGRLTEIELERDGEEVVLDPDPRIVVSTRSVPAMIRSAVAGLGCMCTFFNWVEPYLERGELEPVLPQWWSRFTGPRLYFPSRRHMPATLRAFVDHIAEARETHSSRDR